jgi:hypothetical protein
MVNSRLPIQSQIMTTLGAVRGVLLTGGVSSFNNRSKSTYGDIFAERLRMTLPLTTERLILI